jgi:hypothetical protein
MLRALWLSLLGLVAAQSTVKLCESDTVFKVESLTFTPIYPVSGTNGSLVTVFDVPYQIDSGKSTYSCDLSGLPVWSETYDLCTQTECPIMVGSHTTVGSTAVPSVSGKLDCKIRWSYGDTTLMCVEFILKLGNLRGLPYMLH